MKFLYWGNGILLLAWASVESGEWGQDVFEPEITIMVFYPTRVPFVSVIDIMRYSWVRGEGREEILSLLL